MSSRKEQKEALRREREERERAAREAARRRRVVGYGAGGGLALVALVAVVIALVASGGEESGPGGGGDLLPDGGSVPGQKVTDLRQAVRAAGCELKSTRADSRDHTQDPAQSVRYRLNPPTSGQHFQVPAEDGAYTKAPADTELVHSLEHGRVIYWFKPTLPEDDRADLKALFDEDEGFQLLIVPRRRMPYQVAATAWSRDPEPLGTGQLLGCPEMDQQVFDALRAFRDEHRGNGPEPVP